MNLAQAATPASKTVPAEFARALEAMTEAAKAAGALALPFFRPGAGTTASVTFKSGGSPVTQADIAADDCLRTRLLAAFPQAGWLSEETHDDCGRMDSDVLFIADPIDGTRGFMAGDARWCVSVALVITGRPVAGVLHAPALGETLTGALAQGASCNGRAISVSARPALAGALLAGPRLKLEAMARGGPAIEIAEKIPSLAWRLAGVARGEFDAGLASENSHDWDIAAADIILHEAGGALCALDGAPVAYNRHEPRHGALAAAPPQLMSELLARARRVFS